MILHPKQREIVQSKARFKTARAGRKGGKTAMEVENICYKAMTSAHKLNLSKTEFTTGRKVLYIAPTQGQARNIIWGALKNRLHNIGKTNESRLEMIVPNEDGGETTIFVGGWENRENYRGYTDVTHITFDEVDTLRNFFLDWLEIFRPMFLDTSGSANFIGTPKKENPNLKRLEKDFKDKGEDFASFHFTSKDNPFLAREELEAMKEEYINDPESYKQEILAEYIDDTGALFKFNALVDTFSNTIDRTSSKYLTIDVAGDGTDRIVFSFWEGLVEYKRISYDRLNSSSIRDQIRESAAQERIPFSHILVDAVGVGEHLPHDPLLDGIMGFKSSYGAIKTDQDIVRLPNVGYLPEAKALVSDYKNLRSQCIFTLADLVNNRKIASEVDGLGKEKIIEELSAYQDVSKGDGKRMASPKEDIKLAIGRSPDDSDTWIMRMYFVILERMLPNQSEEWSEVKEKQANQFARNKANAEANSAK